MERPDGSQVTTIGWVLIAIGGLAVFIGAGAETFEGMVWGEPVQESEAHADGDDGFHFCDWCHLGLFAPDVACSRQTETEILADVESKNSLRPECERELKKQGLLSQ